MFKTEQMELTDFLHAGKNSQKLKGDWKFFWLSLVKNGCGENWLYLRNEQMELTEFLCVDTDSQILKVDQFFFGWAWSKIVVASLVARL